MPQSQELAELTRRYERFLVLFELSSDILYILNRQGQVQQVTPSVERVLGYTQEEMQELNYLDLLLAEERATVRQHVERMFAGETARFEAQLVASEGTAKSFDVIGFPLVEDDEIVGAFGVARDISEIKRTQHDLRASEQRYRSLFEANVEAIATLNPEGEIVEVNSATLELLGETVEHLVGTELVRFAPPELDENARAQFDRALGGSPVQFETQMERSDGQRADLCLTLLPIIVDGEVEGVHCIAQDITAQKRLETDLHNMAYHDPLTGLANQRAMHQHLHELLAAKLPFAVMMIDLDRFKSINDRWGHETGDAVLREATTRLRTELPENTRLFRYGGDELVVIKQTDRRDEVVACAEWLQGRFEDEMRVGDLEVTMSASIGIAEYPADGVDIATLFSKADNAMYAAKQRGRNTFALASSVETLENANRLQFELELRTAMRKDQLSLVYQPVVDLETGRTRGVEVLMRWHHPEIGEIGPVDFIPIAEDSGMIAALGAWALEGACQMAARFADLGLQVQTATNVSIHQLESGDFEATLLRLFAQYGVDPELFVLEITESVSSEAPEIAATLRRLRDRGVRISLDDFGTGYSSLQHLREYPVTSVKIDRTFVEGMAASDSDRDLLASIVRLARSLGLKVVAEGIETAAQIAFLREHGVAYGQGYVFSEPLSADGVERWIAEHPPA